MREAEGQATDATERIADDERVGLGLYPGCTDSTGGGEDGVELFLAQVLIWVCSPAKLLEQRGRATVTSDAGNVLVLVLQAGEVAGSHDTGVGVLCVGLPKRVVAAQQATDFQAQPAPFHIGYSAAAGRRLVPLGKGLGGENP